MAKSALPLYPPNHDSSRFRDRELLYAALRSGFGDPTAGTPSDRAAAFRARAWRQRLALSCAAASMRLAGRGDHR